MAQHPGGYPMFLPPFFPVLSPQQLHAMYSAPPPLMTGAMAPPGALLCVGMCVWYVVCVMYVFFVHSGA